MFGGVRSQYTVALGRFRVYFKILEQAAVILSPCSRIFRRITLCLNATLDFLSELSFNCAPIGDQSQLSKQSFKIYGWISGAFYSLDNGVVWLPVSDRTLRFSIKEFNAT